LAWHCCEVWREGQQAYRSPQAVDSVVARSRFLRGSEPSFSSSFSISSATCTRERLRVSGESLSKWRDSPRLGLSGAGTRVECCCTRKRFTAPPNEQSTGSNRVRALRGGGGVTRRKSLDCRASWTGHTLASACTRVAPHAMTKAAAQSVGDTGDTGAKAGGAPSCRA
jgi:hypothetical protein